MNILYEIKKMNSSTKDGFRHICIAVDSWFYGSTVSVCLQAHATGSGSIISAPVVVLKVIKSETENKHT